MLNPPFYPHFGRSARWQDTGRSGTLYYPIWLAYATGTVEEEFKTRLVDAPAWGWNEKDIIVDVMGYKPELIVIDTSFPSLANDMRVAESIKRNTEVKTLLVGPPTSLMHERMMKSEGVDMLARFEYDLAVRDVAIAMESNESLDRIEGISYKASGKIFHNPNRQLTTSKELDELPFVSKTYKEHLDIRDYFLGSSLYPEIQVFTGRGCPSLCTFCAWPQTFMGRKYRVRSIENVLDELEWVQDNLKVNEVFFEDDTFTVDRKRVLEFTQEYRRRDLEITWSCNARVGLDYGIMKEMKSANCRLLVVGYESGCDRILKNVKKGITADQARQFSKYAKKASLLVHGDFIIGLPGETKATVQITKDLVKELKPEILQVSVATPFPGTEFHSWASRNGYLLTDNIDEYLDFEGHQKAIVSYPSLSAGEITTFVDQILKEYYLSGQYVLIALRQIFRRNGLKELRRLLFSFKMFLKYIRRRRL